MGGLLHAQGSQIVKIPSHLLSASNAGNAMSGNWRREKVKEEFFSVVPIIQIANLQLIPSPLPIHVQIVTAYSFLREEIMYGALLKNVDLGVQWKNSKKMELRWNWLVKRQQR